MFGYEEDELLKHTAEIFHVSHETFLNFAELAFNFVLKGKPVEQDYQFKHKDGTLFWIHIAGDVVQNQEEVLWTMVDITKRKNAQKEIAFFKERMELAIEGNKDVIWDWNLADNSLFVSQKWKDIIGFNIDEFPNEMKAWKRHLHPDDLRKVLSDITDNIKGKTEYLDNIHRIRHRDGHWVWIHIRGKTHYDESGKAIRMTGTHSDITHERELELKNTHQSQIIQQIHESVTATDLNGIITSWNRGAEQLSGYKAKEAIGKHIKFMYLEKDYKKLEKDIETLIQTVEYRTETHLVTKFKELVDVDISFSLLRDEKETLIGTIAYVQDITLRKKIEDDLYHQAHHDALTGLPNRVLFNDRLEQGIEKTRRSSKSLALLFLDLDHFKEINDSLGHAIGDEVLNVVTSRINSVLRSEDTLARLGGDEFTVIIENLTQAQNASFLAEKILSVLAKPMIIKKHELYISTSIGISLFPEDGKSVENLLKYADAAMYRAKAEGRNNFQFYSTEMTELAFERVVMESSFRAALKSEDFVVYYQPQVNAKTNKIIGMEALVRWNHPSIGIVSPTKFIPLAESTGLIVELDRFVMRTAMLQLSQWYKEDLAPGVLAMNLSVKQLQQKDFIEIFKKMIKETNCNPQCLELEVTESQIMTNADEAIKILNKISEIGVSLAVDDFGTGYSSLAYLKKLPIDKLKIDQSFIRDLPDDEDDAVISKVVIALAQSLNLKVIAEGVETEEQKKFLLQSGCENIQGYIYSKPVPADEFKTILLKNKMI